MKNAFWVVSVALGALVAAYLVGLIAAPPAARQPHGVAVPAIPARPVADIVLDPPAARPAVEESGIEVKVTRVEIADRYEKKGLLGSIDPYPYPCIHVHFDVRNASESRKYDLVNGQWPTGQLADEHGNRYPLLSDNDPARPTAIPRILKPGESFSDVLVFEPPLKQADTLTFDVQDHFEASVGPPRGTVAIKIPREVIKDPKGIVYSEP